MMRFTLGATLALAALGCDTNLDGGGNGGGGGGDATASGPTTAQTGANGATTSVTAAHGGSVATTTTGASATTTTGASATTTTGGLTACADTEGLPLAEVVFASDRWVQSVAVTDADILLATEELEAGPGSLVRLDKATGDLIDQDEVEGGITSFLHDGDLLLGGGYCNEGGTPFVIGAGPTFTPIAPGCPQIPTNTLAFAEDGVVYADHNLVRWAPLDGGPSPVLAEFLAEGDEPDPIVHEVAADETDVFVSVMRIAFSPDTSWGEIWRVPLDGGERQRLFVTEPVPATGSTFLGGIDSMVLDEEFVYFPELTEGRITRVRKGGSAIQVLWDGDQHVKELTAVGADLAFVEMPAASSGEGSCLTVARTMPRAVGDAVPVAILPGFVGQMVSDGSSLFLTGQRPGSVPEVYRAAAVRP